MALYEGSVQNLTGAGAVDLESQTTQVTSTGTDALTLADGGNGQLKVVTLVVDGGTATLTPTTAAGFSTIAFADAGDTAELQYWNTVGWVCNSLGGLGGGPTVA